MYDAATRVMLTESYFSSLGNESTKILPIIHDFLERGSYPYEDITNILCVVGPGSFT